jgi:hypothetical protein
MPAMAQPTAYTPATDFSADELANVGGRSTVGTAELDAEFAAIALTLSGVRTNLSLNQRDDGEIRDARVKLHTLSTSVLALFAATAGTPRGAWVTATAYALRDVVTINTNTYLCCVAHTSGTFATDLAAVKWLLIALGAAPTAAGIAFTPTATIASTTIQTAIDESDTENRALSAAVNTTIRADLLTAVDNAKGAALVGYGSSLSYPAGSVGAGVAARALSTDVADGSSSPGRCSAIRRSCSRRPCRSVAAAISSAWGASRRTRRRRRSSRCWPARWSSTWRARSPRRSTRS